DRVSIDDQPVSHIHWVNRDQLQANWWNPNHQAPPERRLLRTSILENGWTQPIVTRPLSGDIEIVDGYHRWITAEHPEIAALTDGQVPIVRLPEIAVDLAQLATVRHNRARGTHGVVAMADIVRRLLESGMNEDEISRRLEMDTEEVDRLAD